MIHIYAVLVPRSVESEPEAFLRKKSLMEHSIARLEEFFSSLPEEFKGEIKREVFERESAAFFECLGDYNIALGFQQRNYSVYVERTKVYAPSFDLLFAPVDDAGSQRIFVTALNQFYLAQNSFRRVPEVMLMNGKVTIKKGLEVLAMFLPRGAIVEARRNRWFGNGRVVYEI